MSASIVQQEIEQEKAREERWVEVYSQLTGTSEAQARACWMFATEPAGPQSIGSRPDLTPSRSTPIIAS